MTHLKITAAAAMLACTTLAAQATGISDDKVKIGVLTDMSGQYADSGGKGSVEAAKMAIEDFGGKVQGKPIELVFADHQNKADIGGTKARQWWDAEGVDMIMDLNNSAIAGAVFTLAKERNKVAISTGALSTGLTNEFCAPTTVHYTVDSYSLGKSAVESIMAQGKKDWFILAVDYAYGKVTAATVTDFVKDSGGKVLGTVYHPFNASDFSSFMLQALAAKPDVLALANAGGDTVNAIKSAAEFGLAQKMKLAGMIITIQDVHALGLKTAQGMYLTDSWYWNQSPEASAWARRFFDKHKRMPTSFHAGDYSATLQYLKAVQAAGTDDGTKVMEQLRKTRFNDMFVKDGWLRADGLMVHDMHLMQVKTPAESREPWDYYKVVETIRGEAAWTTRAETRCAQWKTS